MIGKPNDWKAIHARLAIEKFAADTWLEIKNRITENAPGIFEEWVKKYPLEAQDVRNKYQHARSVAKYAVMKELGASNMDEATLAQYKQAIDSLAFNLSDVFQPLVDEAVEAAPAEVETPAPDTSVLPKDIQDFLSKAKILEIIKRIAGKTWRHKHDVEDEERWQEHVLREQEGDPAEQAEKAEELDLKPSEAPEGKAGDKYPFYNKLEPEVLPVEWAQPETTPDVAETAETEIVRPKDAADREQMRIDIIQRILQLKQDPQANGEEIVNLRKTLHKLYSGMVLRFVRQAAPVVEDKKVINDRIPDAAGLAMGNLLNDQKRINELQDAVVIATNNLRETMPGREVDANALYNHLQVKRVLDSLAHISWKIYLENGMKSFLYPYREDAEFISELKDFFIGMMIEQLKDYITNNLLSGPSEQQSKMPSMQHKRRELNDIYQELVGTLDKVLPKWKDTHASEIESFRNEAADRAEKRVEYYSAQGAAEEGVSMEKLENPDEGMLDTWAENILGNESGIAQYVNELSAANVMSPEEAEKLKSALSGYVKADFTRMWNEAYVDWMKAAGVPFKGQDLRMPTTEK